jgi:FlaA1/EpsC-like NDP-sugar epimerase
VKIEYSGLRDGEKLFEELLNDTEVTKPTHHPKIKIAAVREYAYEEAKRQEDELYQLSFGYEAMAVVKKMKEIVPEFKSKHSVYETLDA